MLKLCEAAYLKVVAFKIRRLDLPELNVRFRPEADSRRLSGTGFLQGSRQRQFLEFITKESEFVAEKPCKLGVCRSKEDLPRSADGKLPEVIKER